MDATLKRTSVEKHKDGYYFHSVSIETLSVGL